MPEVSMKKVQNRSTCSATSTSLAAATLTFLISLFLGWLVVWGASWILPVSYKSGTLILVEQPTMPKDYVVPNVNEDLQDRLQNITQQILSRTRLLQIIDQLNLYSGGHTQITPDEKVARMRKDIEIELVQDLTNLKITAFKIYYSAPGSPCGPAGHRRTDQPLH